MTNETPKNSNSSSSDYGYGMNSEYPITDNKGVPNFSDPFTENNGPFNPYNDSFSQKDKFNTGSQYSNNTYDQQSSMFNTDPSYWMSDPNNEHNQNAFPPNYQNHDYSSYGVNDYSQYNYNPGPQQFGSLQPVENQEHPQSDTVLILGIIGWLVPIVSFFGWGLGSKVLKEAKHQNTINTSTLKIGYILSIVSSVIQILIFAFIMITIFLVILGASTY